MLRIIDAGRQVKLIAVRFPAQSTAPSACTDQSCSDPARSVLGAAGGPVRTYDRCVLTPAQPTSWLGTPATPGLIRVVYPARQVVIDLGALYGRPPHFRRPNVTVLAQLHVQVVGLLDAWVSTETGWFAACRYRVKLEYSHYVDQEHLVPARMLRLATDKEVDLGRMRGEIV